MEMSRTSSWGWGLLFAAAVLGGCVSQAASPPGTGSGRLGASVALVVGLTGMVLGGLALARSRRTG